MPLHQYDLYRLWGGDAPSTPWETINLWRCIYPTGQCTIPGVPLAYASCPGPALGPQDGVLYSGLPSHTKAEVTHRVGDLTNSGMWFYWARGSGVYFDLGRTRVFRDHEAMATTCNLTSWEDDVALTSCGRERLGLDSIQFTHHNEQIFKYEILSTQIYRGTQTNGCPDKQHAGLFSKGWDGVLPCVCDPTQAALNCNG